MSPSSVAPLLLSVGLWLGCSIMVGACANHIPLRWIQWIAEPARSRGAPAGARLIYERRLAIRRWKSWIPDAGAVLPGGIRKADLARRDPLALQRLIAETWRAELVHWALWPVWLLTALWLPPLGVMLNLLFATVFNLPCLLLQRYNRLRLIQLLQRFPAGRL